MIEQQSNAVFSEEGLQDLDEMITDFQQKLALGQEEDTVSNDEFEEAAPTTMLGDDIFLLDTAILMKDELVSQAGKAWNDRHTISDDLTPPLQDTAVGWGSLCQELTPCSPTSTSTQTSLGSSANASHPSVPGGI